MFRFINLLRQLALSLEVAKQRRRCEQLIGIQRDESMVNSQFSFEMILPATENPQM